MKHWFAFRVPFHRELFVRDALRKQGLRCYVPLCYQVEVHHGHKVRRLVPAVNSLVFVYGYVEDIMSAKAWLRDVAYWLTRPVMGQAQREKVIIPDKQMNDFIRVTEQREAQVIYFLPDEVSLAKGDRIRIHGGAFDGVEGVLLKVKSRRSRQLVVSIPDLVVAAVSIQPDVVEVIAAQHQTSRDMGADSKQLVRLATQLLTTPPDKLSQANEYHLLHREVLRLYQSLLPLHGYLASAEGELSLALLLAERAMGMVSDSTVSRCKEVITRLRDTSHLKSRLLQELGHL